MLITDFSELISFPRAKINPAKNKIKVNILNIPLINVAVLQQSPHQIYNKNTIWVKNKMLNIVTEMIICDFCHFYRPISIQEEQY